MDECESSELTSMIKRKNEQIKVILEVGFHFDSTTFLLDKLILIGQFWRVKMKPCLSDVFRHHQIPFILVLAGWIVTTG